MSARSPETLETGHERPDALRRERDVDVLVYGTVCLDLVWSTERLATPGGYEPITQECRMAGGEAANSAIALRRWGVRAALIGTYTGDDEDGTLLRRLLADESEDLCSRLEPPISGMRTPFCACIATPDGNRTMYGSGFADMKCPQPPGELLRRARYFTMDPNAFESGIAACRLAHAAGAVIVAMDYSECREVNRLASISLASHERVPGGAALDACRKYACRLRDADGCTAIVTAGERGAVVALRDEPGSRAVDVPAYSMDIVVDTTGAGDVFRAGLLYGLVQGWTVVESADFGAAAAALNCTAPGGWGGVHSVNEIEALRRRGRSVSPAP